MPHISEIVRILQARGRGVCRSGRGRTWGDKYALVIAVDCLQRIKDSGRGFQLGNAAVISIPHILIPIWNINRSVDGRKKLEGKIQTGEKYEAAIRSFCASRMMEKSSTRPQHTHPPARPLGTNRLPYSLDFTPGAWPCKLCRRGFGRLRHTYSPSGYNPETVCLAVHMWKG